jgi:hypothetical protein
MSLFIQALLLDDCLNESSSTENEGIDAHHTTADQSDLSHFGSSNELSRSNQQIYDYILDEELS